MTPKPARPSGYTRCTFINVGPNAPSAGKFGQDQLLSARGSLSMRFVGPVLTLGLEEKNVGNQKKKKL